MEQQVERVVHHATVFPVLAPQLRSWQDSVLCDVKWKSLAMGASMALLTVAHQNKGFFQKACYGASLMCQAFSIGATLYRRYEDYFRMKDEYHPHHLVISPENDPEQINEMNEAHNALGFQAGDYLAAGGYPRDMASARVCSELNRTALANDTIVAYDKRPVSILNLILPLDFEQVDISIERLRNIEYLYAGTNPDPVVIRDECNRCEVACHKTFSHVPFETSMMAIELLKHRLNQVSYRERSFTIHDCTSWVTGQMIFLIFAWRFLKNLRQSCC